MGVIAIYMPLLYARDKFTLKTGEGTFQKSSLRVFSTWIIGKVITQVFHHTRAILFCNTSHLIGHPCHRDFLNKELIFTFDNSFNTKTITLGEVMTAFGPTKL